jgi:uncharacterized protein (DUF3084 family)
MAFKLTPARAARLVSVLSGIPVSATSSAIVLPARIAAVNSVKFIKLLLNLFVKLILPLCVIAP